MGEHPCDEYYKKLYKTEKEKQLKQINNFDKIFHDEVESLSSIKPKQSTDIAQKLQTELDKLLPKKTDTTNIPTFHLDLSVDNNDNETNDQYQKEKQLYLENNEIDIKEW